MAPVGTSPGYAGLGPSLRQGWRTSPADEAPKQIDAIPYALRWVILIVVEGIFNCRWTRGVSAAVAMRGVLDRIGLSPLPGTKAEEAALRELLTREWQWSITSHLEREATEAAVNAVKSPGVLHLATHGFFLPQTGRTDPLERLRGYWETGAKAGG